MTGRYRVVQWTTGNTGRAAVQGIVQHPELDLVGCFAWSVDKVGRDVGELCGIELLGVAATDDVDALLALAPDCVVYTAYRPDFDHLERILGAGVNVVTTMFKLAGDGYGEEATRRLREAAERGQASLYASGIYPGHAPNVALVASAMCRRIDRLSVLESLDIREYANEQMFRDMGYDLDPDDPTVLPTIESQCGSFKDQIRALAHALGTELDAVEFRAELATADEDVDFGFMKLRKGKVAGFQGVIAGMKDGRSVLECRYIWKLGDMMTPNWPVTNGYVIDIEGYPGVRVRLEPLGHDFPGATVTAMPVVNAVPATCLSAPGILNQGDLPFVRGTL